MWDMCAICDCLSASTRLPSALPLLRPQLLPIASPSRCAGTYMASSSNLRYQIVAGLIEERGIEVFFKGNPSLWCALHACTHLCCGGRRDGHGGGEGEFLSPAQPPAWVAGCRAGAGGLGGRSVGLQP